VTIKPESNQRKLRCPTLLKLSSSHPLLQLLLQACPQLLPLKATLSASAFHSLVQTIVQPAQAQHVQAHLQLITKATHGHWYLPALAKQWNCLLLLTALHVWVLWKLLSATCQHKLNCGKVDHDPPYLLFTQGPLICLTRPQIPPCPCVPVLDTKPSTIAIS
jgi:hypothetical protein